MRIGIEAQRLFRPHKHGMDVVALELIKAIQHKDTQNEYFIFVKPDTDDQCLKPSENVQLVKMPRSNYALWEQVHLPRQVQKLRLDVLHCTANTAPLWGDVPLVLTLHDMIFLESKAPLKTSGSAYQRYGNLYRKWVVPPVMDKAHTIVTVSHYEKRRLSDYRPDLSDKISVIYNGLSSHFLQPITQEQQALAKQRYNLPKRYVLFLGNTDPKKNLSNVLKAFGRIAPRQPELMLVVADLPENVLMKELKILGEVPLRRKIQSIGYVPMQYLPVLYKHAEAFLYPSLRESFGLPIIEAMSCRVPVVTSKVAAMPEIAGEAAFLVDPTDPSAIADGIESALQDTPIRQQRIADGLERAHLFSWENAAERMISIYQSI